MTHLHKRVSASLLGEIVDRVVGAASPLKVVLFGSAGRGATHADSDIDLLVVVQSGTHRRQTAQRIYRALYGVGFAVDVVVVTQEDVVSSLGNGNTLIATALEEGDVLFAA